MPSPTILFAIGLIFSLYLVHRKKQRAKLPPGPPRLPIIGNLHQAPKGAPWVTFQKWVEEYGPLVAVDFGGTNLIIVGDHATAKDLLNKRSSISASRPRMVMGQELTCKGQQILFMPWGERFKLHQALEAPVLTPRASGCYIPIQDLESKQLLKNMLTTNDFPTQFEIYAASIMYSLTFGLRIITGEEWQVKTSHECLGNFVQAGQVGKWIVDALPALNHLPKFMAPWKKTAERWYNQWANLHFTNYEDALKREGWNWAKDFQTAKEAQQITAMETAWDLGILCDAGVETTAVTLQIFILACLAYPDWISKARKELDDQVGRERLPECHDLENLPYIQAVLEETFRWRHGVAGGIPHATTQDDYYKGYLIPKGSTILPIFNAMRHDKQIYDAPETFRPERWIDGKSEQGNFGYGKRICPGRHIAKRSILIAMARMLWAFDIRSKDGKVPVVDEDSFSDGFVSIPKPFEAVFIPRSEKHREILEREFEAADKDVARVMDRVREKLGDEGLLRRD